MTQRLVSSSLASLLSFVSLVAARSPLTLVQEPASQHFRFKKDLAGRSMKKGGIEVSFSRFSAEDGTVVERFVEDYRTTEAARASLDEECRRSSKVSEGGFRTDAHGKRVGRRVVLVFDRSASAPKRSVVAWTDGPLLYLLRSESRAHLLDFEHQLYAMASQNR